jgi:hypothetical protein
VTIANWPPTDLGLEQAVQRKRLREDVAAGLGTQGGKPGPLVLTDASHLLLGGGEVGESRVSLPLDRVAQLVLLPDKLACLVLFDLALEFRHACLLLTLDGGTLGKLDFECGDRAGLGFSGLGLQHRLLGGEVLKQSPEALCLLASPGELVILN